MAPYSVTPSEAEKRRSPLTAQVTSRAAFSRANLRNVLMTTRPLMCLELHATHRVLLSRRCRSPRQEREHASEQYRSPSRKTKASTTVLYERINETTSRMRSGPEAALARKPRRPTANVRLTYLYQKAPCASSAQSIGPCVLPTESIAVSMPVTLCLCLRSHSSKISEAWRWPKPASATNRRKGREARRGIEMERRPRLRHVQMSQ